MRRITSAGTRGIGEPALRRPWGQHVIIPPVTLSIAEVEHIANLARLNFVFVILWIGVGALIYREHKRRTAGGASA